MTTLQRIDRIDLAISRLMAHKQKLERIAIHSAKAYLPRVVKITAYESKRKSAFGF